MRLPNVLNMGEHFYETDSHDSTTCPWCAQEGGNMTPAQELEHRIGKYRTENPAATYERAYREVLKDPALRARYSGAPAALAPTPTPRRTPLGPGPVQVNLPAGYVESDGLTLDAMEAGRQLEVLMQQELARHPGVSREVAWRRTTTINPDLHRRYARALTPRDLQRVFGQGDYTVEWGGMRHHVSGGTYRKHDEEIPRAPGIEGGAYISLNGVRRVQYLDFDLSQWSLRGAMEFLQEAGFDVDEQCKVETSIKANTARFILCGPEDTSGVTPK